MQAAYVKLVGLVAAGGALGCAGTYFFLQKKAPAPAGTPHIQATQPKHIAAAINSAEVVCRFGFPSLDSVKYRSEYAMSYNKRTRNPNWVAELLTPEKVKAAKVARDADRDKATFKEDSSIPRMFRVKPSDYASSGYDRGHLVPAADAKSNQVALNETFLMTNISPQVGIGFNRGYWAHFENFVRNLTKSFEEVYVVTGPLYLPQKERGKWRVNYEVIGDPPNVAVPTHFYKVVLANRTINGAVEHSAAGFVLPNQVIRDDTALTRFVVPIEEIERASGLVFFDRVERSSCKGLCDQVKCAVVPVALPPGKSGSKASKSAAAPASPQLPPATASSAPTIAAAAAVPPSASAGETASAPSLPAVQDEHHEPAILPSFPVDDEEI